MTPRPKLCLHRVPAEDECERCDELVKSGKMTERKLVTYQRLWQLQRKIQSRCEICGERKGKCPSKARCADCLTKDVRRHRKGLKGVVPWVPGRSGRKRYIKGAEFNYKRALDALEERRIGGVGRPGEA